MGNFLLKRVVIYEPWIFYKIWLLERYRYI